MNKVILVLFIVFANKIVCQEKLRSRSSNPNVEHELYICVNTDLDLSSPISVDNITTYIPQLKELQNAYGFWIEKGYSISDEKLDEMERNAIKISGSSASITKLRNTFKLRLHRPSIDLYQALKQKIEQLNVMDYCYLSSGKLIPPPGDIPPTTPNFQNEQSYILANPGINMEFAWNMNLTGSGIKLRDVEYGFNKNHEEFIDNPNIALAPGMTINSSVFPEDIDHGTAVLGIVIADKGTYGVTGLAYGAAEMLVFPVLQESGGGTGVAISQAIALSNPGDIIILEIQEWGWNDALVLGEYSLPIWNLTKAATDAGIIVVAAAGNGNANLDSSPYAEYMSRGDSGAIVVGAGSPDLNHDKLLISTFGSRVDLQGWGQNVYTAGVGNLEQIGGDLNQTYGVFSGTSSATPIVASCAAVLQSYYHSLTGDYLTSVELRNILISTGIPQGNGGHIGPLPNMANAIAAINQLHENENETISFVISPNPVGDVIRFYGFNFSSIAQVEIVNSLGQIVTKGSLREDKSFDVSTLANGFYFVRLTDEGKSTIRSFIKN